jgi:CDP-glycerol glycerophosphotransferase
MILKLQDKLRGFHFDFEKNAPGLLVKTSDAVIDSHQDDEI